MTWIVALDLRPSSYGALHFARWLVESAHAEGEQFLGVHVLEEDHLRSVLRLHHLDEVIGEVRRAAHDILEREGVSEIIREVDVLDALYADEGLEAARTHRGGHAIVIGRAARRDGHRIVRLGRVARRTLRRLRSPVVVVPPDVREGDIGDGPIVALTRLSGDSVDACRWASRVARALGRPLVLVHVRPLSGPAATGSPVPAAGERQALAEAWSARHGLKADETIVLDGPPVERAVEFARERRAALLVAGSSLPSTLQRLLRRSTASALAATAPLPVAVVPPSAGA